VSFSTFRRTAMSFPTFRRTAAAFAFAALVAEIASSSAQMRTSVYNVCEESILISSLRWTAVAFKRTFERGGCRLYITGGTPTRTSTRAFAIAVLPFSMAFTTAVLPFSMAFTTTALPFTVAFAAVRTLTLTLTLPAAFAGRAMVAKTS